jgi:acetyl esterase/lipase
MPVKLARIPKWQHKLHPLGAALILILASLSEAAAQARHEMPDNIVLQSDLHYREGKSTAWKLDLAYPKDPGAKPRPALLVIHGGGWIEGDKSSFTSLKYWAPGNIIDFAKLGFVAATINYRMSGEAPFPAALEDCKCAVRWLRAHAQDYHIDVNRIGAYGNSAGGHLALLLGMTEKANGLEGDGPYQDQSSLIQAVISDSGPVDLDMRTPENSGLAKVMSQFLAGPQETLPERIRKASPATYVKKDLPPLLLIYGTADAQVTVGPVDEFVVALQKAGLKDLTYIRLGLVDHCPYSLRRMEPLYPIVNDFFIRTLMGR